MHEQQVAEIAAAEAVATHAEEIENLRRQMESLMTVEMERRKSYLTEEQELYAVEQENYARREAADKAYQDRITAEREAQEAVRLQIAQDAASRQLFEEENLAAELRLVQEDITATEASELDKRTQLYANYAATVREVSFELTNALLAFGSSLYDQQAQWIEENVADEKERDKQIRALRRKEAQMQKALGAFNIFVSTAEAIMTFLKHNNVPMAVIAGATGAIQLAAVLAKPLPQLAQGGIIPATPGGRAVIAGEGGSAEAVVPLDQIGRFMSDINRGGGAGGDTRVIVNLDGKPIIDTVAKASRNRTLLIDARAVVA
jgi:hypothetical protein